MTKTKTSSSKITACPECDSGNLHFAGREEECISCGWKHTAKKPRTTKQAKADLTAIVGADVVELAEKLTTTPSIVDQLVAAVQAAPAPKGERKARQAPATQFTLTAKGAAFTPDPKRSNVKHEQNQVTWLAIKSLFTTDGQAVALADIWATIPTHKDFVGYAKRSGWLAPVAA